MNIKRNFLYNTFYQILIIIIPLITTPYVSRVLGSEGVGRFSYSYAIAYCFVMFAMLGVNNYGNREIAAVNNNLEERSKRFWEIYSLQMAVSLIAIAAYIIYVVVLCEDKTIGWIMLCFVVSAAFDINWFYFGMEEFKITVARNSIVKLITVICIFVFVRTQEDVYIYCFVNVIGMLISQIVLWAVLKKYVNFHKVKAAAVVKHIKPNLTLFIPVIAISVYKYMDKIMLGMMTVKEEVGFYESCDKIVQIPVALITALGIVMLPRITNMIANQQSDEGLSYTKKSLVFTMFVASPMCFGIMAVAKEFVPVFYGAGFDKCIIVFQFLLPSCIFMAFANVVRTQILIPHQRDRVYVLSVVLGAVVNLVANILLIPYFQSVGAAIGTLAAEAAVCIVQCIYIRKDIKIIKYALYGLPFVISSIMMYCIVINLSFNSFTTLEELFVKILIGMGIYLICSLVIVAIAKHKKLEIS